MRDIVSHQPDTALIWIYLCDAMNFQNPPNIAQNCQFCAILSQTADRQSIKRLKIAAEGAQSAPGLNMIWKIYCLVHPVFLVLKKYAKKYLLCHLSRMNIPKCHMPYVIEDNGYNQTRKDQNQKWKELNQELTTWELGRKRQFAWKTKVIKKKNVPPAFPQQDLTNSFCKNRPTRKALRGPEM